MNAATPNVSRYGRRVVEWDTVTLETLLGELRAERLAHDINPARKPSKAEHPLVRQFREPVFQVRPPLRSSDSRALFMRRISNSGNARA
jgi:hypothetical protein